MSTVPMIEPPRGPRSVERPADAGRTALGIYGEAPIGAVDRGGAVQLAGADWVLDWWILGGDRWYVPATEAAVRQQRLGAGPIVQTALRVSGGDVLHRTWAQGVVPGLFVEIENSTKSPVALALAIRPFDLRGSTGNPEVTLGTQSLAVGEAHLHLSLEARDSLPEHNAVIVPLPHGATARILISGRKLDHGRNLPDLATAAKAWESLIISETRLVLPDQRLSALFDQGRGRLSMGFHDLRDRVAQLERSAGRELTAVALAGSRNEAAEVVKSIVAEDWLPQLGRRQEPEAVAAVADGIAWATVLHAPSLADDLLSLLTPLAQFARKSESVPARQLAERALARVAKCAGQDSAAFTIDRLSGLGSDPSVPGTVAELSDLAQTASETGAWGDDEIEPVTQGLIALRHLLVQERWTDDLPEIDFFPEWPTAWRGGAAEIHGLPTAFGRISAAIRWHGYRPALLWQFEKQIQTSVRLRCSSLDQDWASSAGSGEALLAGVREGLGNAPAEGESFS